MRKIWTISTAFGVTALIIGGAAAVAWSPGAPDASAAENAAAQVLAADSLGVGGGTGRGGRGGAGSGAADAAGAAADEAAASAAFDLQSHRGGRGEWTENSLHAFTRSLELGVSTLELDTRLTGDGAVIVWHDTVMTAGKCADTAPVVPDDADFPYAGSAVASLSLAQIQTLDCGYQQLSGYPEQVNQPGSRIVQLADVFDLLEDRAAEGVRLNVETKVVEPGSAEMRAHTRAVVDLIGSSGLAGRVTLQSFDWASLTLAQRLAPGLELVALANGESWLQTGQPGASPHLGGLDIDDFGGSVAHAAAALGFDALSPTYSTVTAQMIDDAHGLGLTVVPWTVSEPALMHALMDLGVDGLITDYPTRLRTVMAERGLDLPLGVTR